MNALFTAGRVLPVLVVLAGCGGAPAAETQPAPVSSSAQSSSAQSTASSAGDRGPTQSDEAARADSREVAVSDDPRDVFLAYRDALIARDGLAAAHVVTESTFEMYDEARTLALSATRQQLSGTELLARFTALMLRVRIPAEELLAMSGRDVFALAVERGWVGSDLSRIDIVVVRTEGDVAITHLVSSGREIPQELSLLRREQSSWRVSLPTFMDIARPALEQTVQQLRQLGGTDENEALLMMIGMTGDEIPPDVWDPPIPNPS